MKLLLITLLLIMIGLLPLTQAETSPKFANYPVPKLYQGATARLQLHSDDARMFRTRLREALRSPVNFAGEYVVSTWGCGTSCMHGGVVSKKTGEVVLFPWAVCCWSGEGESLYTKPNSRLFVVAGKLGEDEEGHDETNGVHGAHFYEFTGGAFKYIRSIAVAERTAW